MQLWYICFQDGKRTTCMRTWIKQLLCRREWIRVADKMVREGHYIKMRTVHKCKKCGKVKYE